MISARVMDSESSFELIQQAQNGDSAALERLLARYRPRLQRWASGRLPRYARDMTDTEDIVQEVLIGTVRNFKGFDQRGEWALQGYMRRAVTNRIRDELRRHENRPRRNELPEAAASQDQTPLELAVGREVFEQYDRALARLDEAEREAAIARIELGCSYQEIAILTDRPSPDAARMFVVRSLEKLARMMAAS
jgi:RNA polymerase sigma factor (sigma-70 family)